jgi:hypothetical protein
LLAWNRTPPASKTCGSDITIPGLAGLLPIPLFNTSLSFSDACESAELHLQRGYGSKLKMIAQAKARASATTLAKLAEIAELRAPRGANAIVTTVHYSVNIDDGKNAELAKHVIKTEDFKKLFEENLKKDSPGVTGTRMRGELPSCVWDLRLDFSFAVSEQTLLLP